MKKPGGPTSASAQATAERGPPFGLLDLAINFEVSEEPGAPADAGALQNGFKVECMETGFA